MGKRIALDNRVYLFDKFFEHGMHLENRVLYLGSYDYDFGNDETGVDFKMAEKFIKGITLLDMEASCGKKPIRVLMNNPGGDWYHGMAIYDAIKACKNEVEIIVYGYAMSMGSIILQAADSRILQPNSRFMIHYGSEGAAGHSKNAAKQIDEGKRINYLMENIYLEKIMEKDELKREEKDFNYLERVFQRIKEEQVLLDYPPAPAIPTFKFSQEPKQRIEDVRTVLKDLLNFDTYLSPKDTIDLGLADEIFE